MCTTVGLTNPLLCLFFFSIDKINNLLPYNAFLSVLNFKKCGLNISVCPLKISFIMILIGKFPRELDCESLIMIISDLAV